MKTNHCRSSLPNVFSIVGIGPSAGGLEALELFLCQLAELLHRSTTMKVAQNVNIDALMVDHCPV
jgi:chemotaxis response regulator CheB